MNGADLDPAELARRVADVFDLGPDARVVGPSERGQLGRVWSVVTSRGRYAVKVPFEAPDPAVSRADADYQDTLRAAGILLPEVVRTPDSEVVADVSEGTRARVYTWVEMGPKDRTLDPAEVGRTVAEVHAVHVPDDRPVHRWHTDPVGEAGWRELAARATSEGAPFAARVTHHVDELVALETLLEPPGPARRCHCDLWADNIRTSPDGLVVFDWENSGPADPAGELPMVMYEFGSGDLGRMRQLYEAYLEAGGDARVTRPGHCSMLIATLGHNLHYGVSGWLDSPTQHERDHKAWWVGQTLDDALTRWDIDEVMAAAAEVTGG